MATSPSFSLLMLGIVGLPVPDETLLTFYRLPGLSRAISPCRWSSSPPGPAAPAASPSAFIWAATFGLALIHRYGKYVHLTEEHIGKAHAWFDRVGHWGLTFGYFVPGVRHVSAYAAGMSEVTPRAVRALRLQRRLSLGPQFPLARLFPGRALGDRRG